MKENVGPDELQKTMLTVLSIDILEKVAAGDPTNSWLYFSMARLHKSIDNKTKAKALWLTVLSLEETDPFAARVARRELEEHGEITDEHFENT